MDLIFSHLRTYYFVYYISVDVTNLLTYLLTEEGYAILVT